MGWMAAGNLCMQEVGSYRAQRVTGCSAAVLIINAIIDQIGQGGTMKGGDEFGPLSTCWLEDRLRLVKVMDEGYHQRKTQGTVHYDRIHCRELLKVLGGCGNFRNTTSRLSEMLLYFYTLGGNCFNIQVRCDWNGMFAVCARCLITWSLTLLSRCRFILFSVDCHRGHWTRGTAVPWHLR